MDALGTADPTAEHESEDDAFAHRVALELARRQLEAAAAELESLQEELADLLERSDRAIGEVHYWCGVIEHGSRSLAAIVPDDGTTGDHERDF